MAESLSDDSSNQDPSLHLINTETGKQPILTYQCSPEFASQYLQKPTAESENSASCVVEASGTTPSGVNVPAGSSEFVTDSLHYSFDSLSARINDNEDVNPHDEQIVPSNSKNMLMFSSNATSITGDEDDALSVQTEQSNDDSQPRRRTSTRTRKLTQKATIMNERELEKLLESQRIYEPRPVSTNEQRAEELEKWVELEKIIKVQRVVPANPENDLNIGSSFLSRVQQYSHFVKFRDQSYWHCNWVPGDTIVSMHPSLVRNFHRVHFNWVEEADAIARSSGQTELKQPQLPSSDDDSADEPEHVDDKTIPIVGGKFSIQRLGPQPKRGRRRYFYYLANGIDPHYLFPEMVIDVGEDFTSTLFTAVRRKCSSRNPVKKSAVYKTQLREVLVKWTHLDESQATWETVERDLEHFEAMTPKYRKAGLQPLDPCGRRLLPAYVRRWLLQLTEELYVLRANLFSTHLRTGSSIDMSAVLTSPKKLPLPSVFTSSQRDWQSKWTDGQPQYLSQTEGGKLHPYQLEGVRWLRHSYYNRVNTILADEMGLGKTIQVIAMLYSLLKEDGNPGPVLVVAPLSTVVNWEREFEFWAPEMRVIVYIGDKKNRAMVKEFEFLIPNSKSVPAFHVLITSYELASLEKAALQSFSWTVLVVDEAHRLKNKQSRSFKDLSAFEVGYKILLTGTPLQNNLEELFHILNFMEPSKFGNINSFGEQWAMLSKDERVAQLHEMLRCHLLRRLKRDVIADLPRKTEVLVPLDLTLFQKRLYKLILTKSYEELRTGNLIFTLMHLQKVCNHPYLIPSGDEIAPRHADGNYEMPALIQVSSKLDLVMRMLPRLRDEGHRVLIFCHFVTMLNLLEAALNHEGFAYERIDGKVRGPRRQLAIDRFNSKQAIPFVFLLSTRAGGEGINLATADTVILYDSDWNPHCDLQALARAHRIGQSNHVIIYRLVTRSTVEERILQVARKKLALSKLLIDPRKRKAVLMGVEAGDEASTSSDTATQSKMSILRLSRSEAHNILKTGIDSLFADEDENVDLGGCSVLETADKQTANQASASQADVTSNGDGNGTEVTAGLKKPTPLVYDDEALTSLLNRDHRVADEEANGGIVEDYLSVFKSAYFSEQDKDNAGGGSDTPMSSAEAGMQDVLNLHALDPPVEKSEVAQFWDRLLRERHERLMSADKSAGASSTPRLEGPQSNRNGTYHNRYDTPLMMEVFSDSDLSDLEGVVEETGVDVARGNALLSSATVGRTVKCEAGAVVGEGQRNRKSRRIPKPTSSSLSNFHRVSRGEGTSGSGRSRGRGGYRYQRNSGESENADGEEGEDREASDEMDLQREDHLDPAYNPLDDDDDWSEGGHSSRQHKPNKKHRMGDVSEPSTEVSPELLSRQFQMAEAYRTIEWGNADVIYNAWTQMANQLPGDDVTWGDEHGGTGKMSVFGFNAHDRQMFLDSVMRHGLPPDGILPPQDWMPHALRSKPPVNLYAYTNLFMQHLYADPLIMDDSAMEWSDGLPKEGVSGLVVLSRIAMIALIRHKVIQYEEFNAVPRRYRQTPDNRFRFTIHEGGLTRISRIWRNELQSLGVRFSKANEAFSVVLPGSDAVALRQRRLYSVILRRWHHRHDFWLLAGIHVHGYAAWTEILADRRFNMLILGLAGQVMPSEAEADPLCLNKSDDELSNELRETFAFSAEVHCFLLDRLRLLEQALMVEEFLFNIALAAIGRRGHNEAARVRKAITFLSSFSNELSGMGPHKFVVPPNDPIAAADVVAAVEQLKLLLDDIYADEPGLMATLSCVSDDSMPGATQSLRLDQSPIPPRPPPVGDTVIELSD